MSIYQFLFYDEHGMSPALDFALCADDADAAWPAMELLTQHPSCIGVDVFQDNRWVFRLERS